MTDSTDQTTAKELAKRLHAGQTDKAGEPYVLHLERVVSRLTRRFPDATKAEIEAAWLHDALEDTEATPESLAAAGVSSLAVQIVQALTRPQGRAYLDWIADLAQSGSLSAVRVKIADNEDNRDPDRVAKLPGAEARVATRYEPARLLLEARLSHP